MTAKVYLAVDLGASSGRVLAGAFDGSRLELEEIHRFANGPIVAHDRMYWDLLQLWQQVQEGLRAAEERFGDRVASVGVDTWGVDFGLLGPGEELLGNPYHYRDRRTQGMLEYALGLVSREEIFAETGLQFMELNTLYQLLAIQRANPRLLEAAETLLMIPDLFHWLLTGEQANEFTDASTTQLLNPKTQNWSSELLQKFGLPERIFGQVVPPGTRVGGLRKSVLAATGLRSSVEVILPGTHDTASAVMAVPVEQPPGMRPNWCYISSGTWSLMGIETAAPIITSACQQLNFTNEGGVGGTTRVLKNIAGLWILQECRRIWEQRGENWTWDRMVRAAQEAEPFHALINPDDAAFVAPEDMPQAIQEFCRAHGEPAPETHGAVIRCALESLALRYRLALGWLEDLVGGSLDTIHIVGGGTNNQLLCQMTADACDRRVTAGPVEATAIGNLMMQSVASADVGSIPEARAVIRSSFPVTEYVPTDSRSWDAAFARYERLC